MFDSFIAITFGFTFGDEDVTEDTGTVTLDVSVISGTLQRTVDVTFSTMELATSNAAKSKIVYVMDSFLHHKGLIFWPVQLPFYWIHFI